MVAKKKVSRKQGERGFTIIVYALMVFVVLGFTGLAIDAGYIQWQKRLMQSAADAAAMGALREMELGRTNTQPSNDLTLAAQNDAALNGFTDGTNGVSVALYNPPNSGAFAGSGTAAQVIISRNYPTFFMRILGTNSITVKAQSVAQTTTSYGSIGGCIYALNPTTGNGLVVSGGTTIVTTSCSAVVESDNTTQAFVISGGATWNFTSHNAHVGVVGGSSSDGDIYDTTVSPKVAETPATITSPGDPLKNIATPGPTTSTTSTPPTTNTGLITTIQATNASYSSNTTISPGVYCNGITVHSPATVTLNPGVYIMVGGGLTVSSNGANLIGTGVMFYNTSGNSGAWGSVCPGGHGASPMTVSGGGTSKLSAATSGTWCGMLFYEDRALSNENNAVTGNSGATFDGAMYFKNSKMSFTGNNSSGGYMVLVADTITISGASQFGNNYATLSDPNPFAPGATGGGMVQ